MHAVAERLFGAYFTEDMQEFIVDSSGVVGEGSDNALDAFAACGIKENGGVYVLGILQFGPIDDWGGFVQ